MQDQNKQPENDQKIQADSDDNSESSGFLSVLQSTFAALFGIQSEKNRQKDFKKGSATNYIVFGFLGVLVLLFLMNMLVTSVIQHS